MICRLQHIPEPAVFLHEALVPAAKLNMRTGKVKC